MKVTKVLFGCHKVANQTNFHSGTTGRLILASLVVMLCSAFTPAFAQNYLSFSSDAPFTLNTGDTTKSWDGTLYYSTDTTTWTVWMGTDTISSSTTGKLYLRGTGNTVITGNNSKDKWVLTGTGIACSGNIENLLDYATVAAGNHPIMAEDCYSYMFSGCTSLTTPPALPATNLAEGCYLSMFYDCTSLTTAPALPATNLANYCYWTMFSGCTSLTTAPALPATNLAVRCYWIMFGGCTSLTIAPALPATNLANYCYLGMFDGCTSLTTAPALPATNLIEDCYQYMFSGCTSLTTAPALPATNLANYCYFGMFEDCTSLTTPPALPATNLIEDCYLYMFSGCTSLKVSETQTAEYSIPWTIPTSGTIIYEGGNWNTNMLTGTGGTFTANPVINTTYYLNDANAGVPQTSKTESLVLYPNPASDIVTISELENTSANTLQVYDLSGRLVLSQELSGTTTQTINVSTLAKGVYMVRMGRQVVKLVVK